MGQVVKEKLHLVHKRCKLASIKERGNCLTNSRAQGLARVSVSGFRVNCGLSAGTDAWIRITYPYGDVRTASLS
jgi:hypothetical protein